MFFPEGAVRVHLYGRPVDMRKSFDGLYALARHDLKLDPTNGNGALVFNVPGALIHFVEENGATLMLLVSPRIFRHYLDDIGEGATGEPEGKIGAALQKDFFKAGWHRAGPKKMNILRYYVK